MPWRYPWAAGHEPCSGSPRRRRRTSGILWPITTLADIAGEEFVSLTTFRRSGAAVSVPVWIAPAPEGPEVLLVTTTERSGKVTRLRRDPRVELRACDRHGEVMAGAPMVPAVAEVVDDPVAVRELREAIRAKYGERMKVTAADREEVDPEEPARSILRITAGPAGEPSAL